MFLFGHSLRELSQNVNVKLMSQISEYIGKN